MSDQKPERRTPAAFRLKPETREILRRLAERRGITRTAMLEVLIRDEADRKGIPIPKPAPTTEEP